MQVWNIQLKMTGQLDEIYNTSIGGEIRLWYTKPLNCIFLVSIDVHGKVRKENQQKYNLLFACDSKQSPN